MQLKRRPPEAASGAGIGASLAAATCALLGGAAPALVAADESDGWDTETSVLYYGEGDSRVQDLSANALVRKAFAENRALNLRLTVDALTGASPNGAAPSTEVQTFTRPSGAGGYKVAAGELPLDDTFKDTRVAVDASWSQPLGRLTLVDFGLGFSQEYDYTHVGANASIAREFNKRNTTLSAGIAYASDSIDPVGGMPTPFAPMGPAQGDSDDDGGEDDGDDGDERSGGGSGSKDVADLLLGVTQVLGPRTLLQVNYSFSNASGYLDDPYKILSVVDPVTGELVSDPQDGSGLYLYEKRPDTRSKQSMFALVKREIRGDVIEASYRYMTDDWGIDSNTVDLHYRWAMGEGRYLQPHLRFYSQTAADFYQTVLFDGAPLPAFASADYRLGTFDGITWGLKYGWPGRHGDWSTRLELYEQTGEASPGAAVGVLETLDLNPGMQAVIAQFSFKFRP